MPLQSSNTESHMLIYMLWGQKRNKRSTQTLNKWQQITDGKVPCPSRKRCSYSIWKPIEIHYWIPWRRQMTQSFQECSLFPLHHGSKYPSSHIVGLPSVLRNWSNDCRLWGKSSHLLALILSHMKFFLCLPLLSTTF